MPENPISLAKKYVGRAALASSLMLSGGVACESNTHNASQTAQQTIERSTATELQPPSENYFGYFYPEFAQTHLKATEDYYIDQALVDSDIPGEVTNYTNYKVQMDVVNEIYKIFEFYRKESNLQPLEFRGALGNPSETILVTPWQQKVRSLIYLPANAPTPHSEDPTNLVNNPSGITFNRLDAGFSFVRTDESKNSPYYLTVHDYATLTTAVEICQQSLKAKLVDANGQTMAEDVLENSQEVVCNSFGVAISSKLLGRTYSEYSDFLRKIGIGKKYFPFMISENAYDSFATIGTVIK